MTGLGKDIATSNLVTAIAEIVGFEGEFVHNTSKPDGTSRKLLDINRLKNLGWALNISLRGYNFPISIPGEYWYDAYFGYRCMSWGWGSWADRWGSVDWDIRDYRSFLADAESRCHFNRGGEDLTEMLKVQMAGKIDSWAIRWCYAHYSHNAFCLYPVISKVLNIGHDASGTHGRKSSRFFVNLDTDDQRDQFRFPETYAVDESIQQAFFAFNRLNPPKQAKYLAKRLDGRKVRP